MNGHPALTVAFGAVAIALAACSGSHTAAPGFIPSGTPPNALRPQHRPWMDLNVAKEDLLYVSNANAEVTVYQYWKHGSVGVLTDFTQPMGECADSSSNVYITDAGTQEILEFTHGGTKPIKKFNDAPNTPYTCAVDPATGDLAVANQNGSAEAGSIAIWKKGSSSPTIYADSLLYYFEGCAYDDKGNLLVTNGYDYYSGTYFAWLPKGGAKLIDIDVPSPYPSRSWGAVRGIQWDGKYFTLDDYYIYRIALIHGQAYYVGQTQLDSGGYAPYWIYNNGSSDQGTQVVGAVDNDSEDAVNYWHYPSGGEPIFALGHAIDRAFGVTVSLKTQR